MIVRQQWPRIKSRLKDDDDEVAVNRHLSSLRGRLRSLMAATAHANFLLVKIELQNDREKLQTVGGRRGSFKRRDSSRREDQIIDVA